MLKSHTSPGHAEQRENQRQRWERLNGITDGMSAVMKAGFINPHAVQIKMSACKYHLVCVCVACVKFCSAAAAECFILALRR